MDNRLKIAKAVEYIKETLGLSLSIPERVSTSAFPVYFQKEYTLYRASIENVKFLFLINNQFSETQLQTKPIRSAMDIVQKHFECNVIFVSERFASSKRKSLIEHKYAFLIPGYQMYIPQLGVLFRERTPQNTPIRERFSPFAQAIVLGVLNHLFPNNQGLTSNQITHCFPYTKTSISRTFKELEKFGLAEIVPQGRLKLLRFYVWGRELWKQSLPYMQTPVQRTIIVSNELRTTIQNNVLTGGESALSHYTQMSTPASFNGAIYLRNIKLSHIKQYVQIELESNCFLLDLWHYPVTPFNKNGYIDPLSLYLQFRDDSDDRIQLELKRLLERISW